ncbi:MAG: ParB/RepB/Spo0J family partition protein [Clostridiales bacterium]|jgi:ParB family chromosome partitioning protein|nr:ParB/RepB/Spo0J family partition protein [Clostridiales bacterium]MDR2711593.1 ParB/RepB/Spo0J family partition protein [Clostridiales bacterium]
MNKKALGKGLAALIPDRTPEPVRQEEQGEQVVLLPLASIRSNPAQPRKDFDEDKLQELAASLQQYGVIQPVLVSSGPEGSYELIAGERRWRAAKIAGLETIPVIIRDLPRQESSEISLIENIQRQDLNPLEEGESYRQLLENFNYTQEQLAQRLGKSRPHIANTLRLLTLAPAYQELMRNGNLSAGHGRALLMVESLSQQAVLAAKIMEQRLSVRQAEEMARELNKQPPPPVPMINRPRLSPILQEVENRLRTKLGTKAQIRPSGAGGQIMLEYYSEGDLQRLLDYLLPDEEF